MIQDDFGGRQLRNSINFKTHSHYYNTKNKVTEQAMILWNDFHQQFKRLSKRENFKDAINKHYLHTYN